MKDVFFRSPLPRQKKNYVSPFEREFPNIKKKLEKVKKGDEFSMYLYGSPYDFFLDQPLVFYAGGIGISVFRSILKKILDTKAQTAITLFYSNRTEDFIFKEELDEWAQKLKLTVHYIPTQKVGRLNRDKLQTFIPKITDKKYHHYMSDLLPWWMIRVRC